MAAESSCKNWQIADSSFLLLPSHKVCASIIASRFWSSAAKSLHCTHEAIEQDREAYLSLSIIVIYVVLKKLLRF